LRAAGETETTQENIQDWLQLDEGDPGYQILTEEENAAVIFFIYLRRDADKSLAFPICSTTKRFFLEWVKEVRTTKS
jgi:hypothetical protein